MRRATVVLLVAFVAMTGCSFGAKSSEQYRADFIRAIQVFPGVKVRVLGVNVGVVTDIRNVAGAVQVTFRLDPGVKLPANVQAAVVPMSLLGERYIQLFPAYESGPALAAGATIPMSRTAVPAEPDELLRSLQDYLGGLDSKTVTTFVENLAATLQGNGADLNRLIHHGASVMATLSAKRDDLAGLIVELNRLSVALATRQAALGRLIRNYDAVVGTLNTNRTALEGTITGLNSAALQLASLLIAHRTALHADIKTLTRVGRSLSRNEASLARTSMWATKLFLAASRAVDFDHSWLRLGNQGQELGALILLRLEQRLMQLCQDAGITNCSTPGYWSVKVPQLFCWQARCPSTKGSAAKALAKALQSLPKIGKALKQHAGTRGTTVQDLIALLLQQTVGNPSLGDALGLGSGADPFGPGAGSGTGTLGVGGGP